MEGRRVRGATHTHDKESTFRRPRTKVAAIAAAPKRTAQGLTRESVPKRRGGSKHRRASGRRLLAIGGVLLLAVGPVATASLCSTLFVLFWPCSLVSGDLGRRTLACHTR